MRDNTELTQNMRASLSLEAAIESVMLSLVIFSFFGLFQYVYLYFAVSEAAISAAASYGEYSCVFYKSGLRSLSQNVQNEILSAVTGEAGDSSSNLVVALADTAFGSIENGANELVLKQMIEKNLEERKGPCGKLFEIEPENLIGSSFYQRENEFTLCVKARSRFTFPTLFPGKKGVSCRVCVKANGWLYGGCTRYTVDEINVWELNNFQRGRVLENVMDSNLPEKFPAVDIFDKKTGTATSIASIDLTAPTYGKTGKLKQEILKYAQKLGEFQGGSCDGATVEGSWVKKRILVMVYPENDKTDAQFREMLEAANESSMKYGVQVTVKNYQHSYRYEE